jgi:hypothetical protein
VGNQPLALIHIATGGHCFVNALTHWDFPQVSAFPWCLRAFVVHFILFSPLRCGKSTTYAEEAGASGSETSRQRLGVRQSSAALAWDLEPSTSPPSCLRALVVHSFRPALQRFNVQFDCQRSRAFDLKFQICALKSIPPTPDAKDPTPDPRLVKSQPSNS